MYYFALQLRDSPKMQVGHLDQEPWNLMCQKIMDKK